MDVRVPLHAYQHHVKVCCLLASFSLVVAKVCVERGSIRDERFEIIVRNAGGRGGGPQLVNRRGMEEALEDAAESNQI